MVEWKKETWVDRGKRATKAMLGITNGKVDRGAQFRNYLAINKQLCLFHPHNNIKINFRNLNNSIMDKSSPKED